MRLTELGAQESFGTVKAADQSPPLYARLNKLLTTLRGCTPPCDHTVWGQRGERKVHHTL